MLSRTCILFFLIVFSLPGQRNLAGTPEIKLALDRLNTLGSVLMIAAHPDDENTALIAYFARGRNLRTAYLALTRGEGGQNLIGSEQSDKLGIIRTEELLAARKLDGGEQYFTRFIDFGFSKTAGETLSRWGRDNVLADMVFNIRRFRPDVIVLRFSGTPRDGHGHHQTSALIAREAFAAAADPARFPEQLSLVQPWQTKRMVFNTFAFTREQEAEAARTPNRLEIDTGEFSPLLGYSYGEIAGMSRSEHRSQGMGSSERKGSQRNILLNVAGDAATRDLFEGIDTSWSRVRGGAPVGEILAEANRAFDPMSPDKILPLLVKARPMIAAIADPWARQKLTELDQVIALCAGLWVDASAETWSAVPGSSVKIQITAINRSRAAISLARVRFAGPGRPPVAAIEPAVLAYNRPLTFAASWKVPEDQPYSQPYWLRNPSRDAAYAIPSPEMLGIARTPPVLQATFTLKAGGEEIEITRPVEHRYVDRVTGEHVRPFVVAPPVAVDIVERALMFVDEKSRRIEVPVKANTAGVSGELRLEVPAGWKAEPAAQPFQLAERGQQKALSFVITPPAAPSSGTMRAVAKVGGRDIAVGMDVIEYSHIPAIALFPQATAELVRADVRTLSRRIGYVMGAGDEVPDALRQMGVDVTLLSSEDLARADLSRFDAIVTGVRAYNTRPDLRANQQRLLDYVSAGGAMVVQYNVLEGGFMGGNPALLEKIGPYPIRVSRERVTVEDAPVTLLNPNLPFLKSPNPISAKDFDGWVQERGLYFASEWDPKYEPVLETRDPEEQPQRGGMLYLKHGKGVYIFSAYSWFRQLPAGVPGAWRLFANMISAGKVATD
ncbi:MAG: PIG-L family deacetylase [Bryobacteraceae bacterium]|nr:PIG-L family deacetylase [Bryobacteraceae bacterium]